MSTNGPTSDFYYSENVMVVKRSVQHSPQHSACKHVATLKLSATSEQKTLYEELQLHPYKIMLAQEQAKLIRNPKSFVFGTSTKYSQGCFVAVQQ